jgi:iron-sulfur cluster repair protein YtfE (RIC family)
MPTATEALLKDHKMIRTLLADLRPDNPRLAEIAATLQRVTLAHAWFEDEFLMPVLKNAPGVVKPFWQEIAQEHNDIAALLELVRSTPPERTVDRQHRIATLRVVLETHFTKEEEVLFPLAEATLGEKGSADLAARMEARKTEVRPKPPVG